MTDLHHLFRSAKTLPAPDDWPQIMERAADDAIGEHVDPTRPRVPTRIGAGIVAVSVSVAAAVFVWSAFRETSAPPLDDGLAPTTSAEPTPSYRYLYPFFRGDWHVHDSGEVSAGDGSVAWASNVPFDPADLDPRAPAIPANTIVALPPDGIVLSALVVTDANDADAGPWPPGSLERPRLADATVRGPDAEEPPGEYAVYEIDGYALIRVYFGSPDPSADAIAAAQAELDTLEVPPTCPVPAEGSFPETMRLSADEGAPGTPITLTAVIPFQHEDGSYDRAANTVVELWWDANPDDWVQLFADPGSVPGTLLGSGGTGSCFLSVTITVPPNASPGDHRIVALSTDVDRTGGSLFGTAVVHVTG